MSRFSSLIPIALVGGCGILTAVVTFQPEFEKQARRREEEEQQKQLPVTENQKHAITVQQPSERPSMLTQGEPTKPQDEKPNSGQSASMTSRILGWFSSNKATSSAHDTQVKKGDEEK